MTRTREQQTMSSADFDLEAEQAEERLADAEGHLAEMLAEQRSLGDAWRKAVLDHDEERAHELDERATRLLTAIAVAEVQAAQARVNRSRALVAGAEARYGEAIRARDAAQAEHDALIASHADAATVQASDVRRTELGAKFREARLLLRDAERLLSKDSTAADKLAESIEYSPLVRELPDSAEAARRVQVASMYRPRHHT
ncbi:MAG: hypothetical protein R2749_01050 [Acidimicrobiales bacterium]